MLGHLGINVPDLDAARRYYGELLPRVGFDLFVDGDDQFAYLPAGGKRGTFLFFYPARSPQPYSRQDTTGLQHLAFMVRSRTAVHEVHEWAQQAGSSVLHEPQEFPAVSTAVLRDVLARPLRAHARSRVSRRRRLTSKEPRLERHARP